MPTIPEIKAQLKERGIKGTTGKNKAELMAMLADANLKVPAVREDVKALMKKIGVPLRKRPQVAPVSAPEVPKRKRPQVAPAPVPAAVPKRKRPQVAPAPAPAAAPILTKKEKEAAFEEMYKDIKKKQKELEKEILKIIPVKNDLFEDIMFDADGARILALSGRMNEYYNLWLTISKKIKLYGKEYLTSNKTLELANKIKNYTEQVFGEFHKNLEFTWNPTEGKYV